VIRLLSNGSLEQFKSKFGEKIGRTRFRQNPHTLYGKVMEEVATAIGDVRNSDNPLPHKAANLMHIASKAMELSKDFEPTTEKMAQNRSQQQRRRGEKQLKVQAHYAIVETTICDGTFEAKLGKILDILKDGSVAPENKDAEDTL
jgi:hypothetical protein